MKFVFKWNKIGNNFYNENMHFKFIGFFIVMFQNHGEVKQMLVSHYWIHCILVIGSQVCCLFYWFILGRSILSNDFKFNMKYR